MRTQPAASPTDADLARVLEREFPGEPRAAEILSRYGGEDWHGEPTRVKVAILKMAAGDLGKLELYTSYAATDYRDVLGPAEYPHYSKLRSRATEADRDAAIERDQREYERWLRR
ncbi:MAG TPA: hypothetical protein VJ826_03960 [Candidatus Polarisedimenticolaceae bacterium]|nr:hypothetical protein [Candidatus Polarisedimenticolaceae bacterium]